MRGALILPTLLCALTLTAAVEPIAAMGVDTRIGGVLLNGPGCLYAVGGGNVFGTRQIMRITLDDGGNPVSSRSAGQIFANACGRTAAAVWDRWLYVTGGDHGEVTVRFDISDDGKLSNRTELPNAVRLRFSHGAMVSSGNHLLLVGGWNSRSVFSAEVLLDGSLGPWTPQRAMPCICFTEGRAFRIGRRLYAAGNQTYEGDTERVYSAELDAEGLPVIWRRAGELPECVADFRFSPLPGNKGVFYMSGKTGRMYVARADGEGMIGKWFCIGSSPEKPLRAISTLGVPLRSRKFFRYNFFSAEPRKFHPPILVPFVN